MRVIKLLGETDIDGWRAAARQLRQCRIPPEAVMWTVAGQDELLPGGQPELPPGAPYNKDGFRVSREFVELADMVILNRAPERFALLYRLLWRLADQPHLIRITTDPDVARALDMAKAVSRASHKMKAFVRFRLVEGVDPETFVAWFEPSHRVLERTAPFFVERFANMRFSILTPDASLYWDTERLAFGLGADPTDAPGDDALEEIWRTYYASTFNPARLKVKMMTKEMPKRYWRNLPEASLIPELIAAAETRTVTMVQQAPTQPSVRAMKAAQRIARDGAWEMDIPGSLEDVAAGVSFCRRCEMWRDATQGVPGQGAQRADLMFVGEQPGDQEDLAGLPFVGPAGKLFDKALAEAGVPRDRTYVTNAVKHFKHEPTGKRRIHKTPNAGEVTTCRWWLNHERRLVRPKVIVALGATAALSVFGKPTPVAASRGRAMPLAGGAQGVVTYHPSYLLRVPDEAVRATAWTAFVEDLGMAWALAS